MGGLTSFALARRLRKVIKKKLIIVRRESSRATFGWSWPSQHPPAQALPPGLGRTKRYACKLSHAPLAMTTRITITCCIMILESYRADRAIAKCVIPPPTREIGIGAIRTLPPPPSGADTARWRGKLTPCGMGSALGPGPPGICGVGMGPPPGPQSMTVMVVVMIVRGIGCK